MDFDPDNFESRFSRRAYNSALSHIRGKNPQEQFSSLTGIAETLVFADESNLNGFPCSDFAEEFVRLVKNPPTEEIRDISSQCILNFLSVHPHSTRALVDAGLYADYKQLFTPKISKDTRENMAHSFCIISKYRTDELIQNVEIADLIDSSFKPSEQRFILNSIYQIVRSRSHPSFSTLLPKVSNLLQTNDPQIFNLVSNILIKVLKNNAGQNIPPEVGERICALIPVFQDDEILIRLLKILAQLCRSTEMISIIFRQGIDFERFLFSKDFGPNIKLVRSAILKLAIRMLPVDGVPFLPHTKDKSPDSKAIAQFLQPHLFNLLLVNTGCENRLLLALACSLRYHKTDVPTEVLKSISKIAQNPNLMHLVLFVALGVPNSKDIAKTDIPQILSFNQPSMKRDIIQWYETGIKHLNTQLGSLLSESPLSGKTFSSPSECVTFLNQTEFTSFQFLTSGVAKQLTTLLTQQPDTSLDIQNVVKVCFDLLQYLPIPSIADPMSGSCEGAAIARGGIVLDLVKEGGKTWKDVRFTNLSSLVALENWYNEKKNRISAEKLASYSNPIVQLEHLNTMSPTELGFLHRAFKTRGYQRFSFNMDGKLLGHTDFLAQNFIRSLGHPEEWRHRSPTVTLVPDAGLTLSPVQVPKTFIDPKMAQILDLLAAIHQIYPSVSLRCPLLEKRLSPLLKSVFLTCGLFSPSIQIGANYPFLFSKQYRIQVCRACSFDLFSVISNAARTHFNEEHRLKEHIMSLNCTIKRNNIFQDGKFLLETFGTSPIQFNISFEGEAGFGMGPTVEFIGLFGKELCKKIYKLWRNDKADNSPYSWSEKGLYPHPGGDAHLFYLLGILFAKAITINTVVPIPLNLEFLKLALDPTYVPDINEIDPFMKQSLDCPEGLYGLTFEYPGSAIQLKPNGNQIEVDESNVLEYIDLVKEKTFCREQVKSFMDGFTSVVQAGVWNILSPTEFSHLLTGEDVSFQMEDLEANVTISHGYSKTSPQIKMFFESLCELTPQQKMQFIKFITGCDRLPIGGFSAIHPKISIARKVDEEGVPPDKTLPSVSTCVNYFKLPPYSSKEIMKERIIFAISEGQGAFLLS